MFFPDVCLVCTSTNVQIWNHDFNQSYFPIISLFPIWSVRRPNFNDFCRHFRSCISPFIISPVEIYVYPNVNRALKNEHKQFRIAAFSRNVNDFHKKGKRNMADSRFYF